MKDKTIKGWKLVKTAHCLLVTMLLLIFIAIYFYAQDKRAEEKIDNSLMDTNEAEYELKKDEYYVDIKTEDESRIIRNEKAGISIIVPSDWASQSVYSDDVNKELKLKVYKSYSSEPEIPTEMGDGVIVEIYMYPGNDFGLKEWMAKEKIDNIDSYEIASFHNYESYRMLREFSEFSENDDDLDVPPYGDWASLSYFLKKEESVYEISCYAVGEEYKKYINECDSLLLNKITLE